MATIDDSQKVIQPFRRSETVQDAALLEFALDNFLLSFMSGVANAVSAQRRRTK